MREPSVSYRTGIGVDVEVPIVKTGRPSIAAADFRRHNTLVLTSLEDVMAELGITEDDLADV